MHEPGKLPQQKTREKRHITHTFIDEIDMIGSVAEHLFQWEGEIQQCYENGEEMELEKEMENNGRSRNEIRSNEI